MAGATPLLYGWLAVCGLKREAQIWGEAAAIGGGRADRLAGRLEAMIAEHRPKGLVSFGLAGALSPALALADVVIGASVTLGARAWTCDTETATALASLFGAEPTPVFGADQVVADSAAKAVLGAHAAAVDMESQVAADAAERHGLPLAVLRVVSDAAHQSLPSAAVAGFREDGGIDVAAVIAAVARDPRQLPALIEMGRNSSLAFRRLKQIRARLG
jgi:purine-nucleoside phosphorylase